MTEELDKEFLNHAQAKALVELGFNKPCFGWFISKNYGVTHGFATQENLLKDAIVAPTYSQAFDFFREKLGLDSFCRQTLLDGASYWKISKIETNEQIKGYSGFANNYRKAELACLDKLIKIAEKNGTRR